jgi:uncharacterized protein YjcR
MATIDTHKTRLIQRILEIPSEKILVSIENLIDSYTKKEVVVTNKNQKKAIHQGIEDIKNGDFYTQEEVEKMDSEWLK